MTGKIELTKNEQFFEKRRSVLSILYIAAGGTFKGKPCLVDPDVDLNLIPETDAYF